MVEDINKLELMTFSEASERWGKERTYLGQQYKKYPNKFLEGTVTKIGTGKGTLVITKKGMEHLTKKTEQEIKKERWLVRHEKNWIVDFEQIVDSKDQAKKLTALKATEELQELGIPLDFKKPNNQERYILRLNNNSIYSFEKI